jgi:hypothetical protein
MLLLSLVLAGTAGFFSVYGLSQMFAGSRVAVIVMATVLEVGKIATTTMLHTYWLKFSKVLKIYLTISVVVLMVITSAGIYGFLSSAYQTTANKLEIHEGEVNILDVKKQIFEKTIEDNKKIIEDKTKVLNQTSDRLDKRINNIDYTKSNQSRNADRATNDANKRLEAINKEIDELNNKNISLSDSVNKYNVKILELKSNNKVSGEIGPLKYISELTGTPLANIVNYMILLLIFVFDPLAVALVLATNKIFQINKNEKEDINKDKLKEDEIKFEEESLINEEVNDEFITDEEVDIINSETPTPEKKEEVQKENFEDFVQKKKKKLEEDRKIFLPLLKSFYKEGEIKAGNVMPTYPEFNELVKNSGYSDDNIKMFLTLCNYLEITELSDNIRKSKVDYEEAKNMMNKYLSLEEKDIVEEIKKEEEKIESINENLESTNENVEQTSKDWWNRK